MNGQTSGQIVGYARVSTEDQRLDRQIEALGEVDKLFTEKFSGKSAADRPQLQEMMSYVRSGDTVRVKSPDRLARSTTDLLAFIEKMTGKGVGVEFVDNASLNTDSPQGRFMLTILGAVAELERATIRERQAEGIAIAKRKGVYQRGTKITPDQISEARERIAAGVPKAQVARDLGVSRQTLYDALAGTGAYAA
ncbi:recombinase family protein [Corynebacterium falsenii]|uniref:recombinase family protein n=1 Tax=Corynebacterium falsenii TaxID=108486 RepID=UPI001D291657|nr:recombinase family protein [Corynebacterium falsenii]HJF11680.1 recombinase family protein [Corynebacterium falsenii]